MKELPKGYTTVKFTDGSELLVNTKDRILLYWNMDGTEEGFYEISNNVTATSKEEMKEILDTMTAYLEGAK